VRAGRNNCDPEPFVETAMPSPDVLDFAKLLAPIPGDKPTGADPRANVSPSSPYYKVKDARTAARTAERQVESGAEDAPTPDWKAVITAATSALATAAKDLEVTAYLIEALTRVHGYAGLRDGFRLARELVTAFWDDLYPTPDEEGVSTKVAALAGLNGDDAEGTLLTPIRVVPLTASDTHGGLSYANYQQALATSKILDPKVKEKKVAAGAMTFEKFQSAMNETSNGFVKTLYDDLTAALDEYGKLTADLDARCGAAAPPSSAIVAALTGVLDAVKDVARDKLAVMQTAAPVPDAPSAEANGKAVKDDDDAGGGEKLPVIRNREDALNAILRLADFFRRTEPHSMVPHTLEQAVRWARMPLTDLLAELISDDDARGALFKQVGIRGMSKDEK
jgi:type VI secretion system protein ImpA